MKTEYHALDGLRALACIDLVCLHVYANITIKAPDNQFITFFFDKMVFLFMLISAFSLSCGYFDKFQGGCTSINDFYKRRYQRVLPLFAFLVLVDVLYAFISEGFSLTPDMKGTLYQAYADLTLSFGFIVDSYTDIEVIGVGWFLGVIFIFYMLYPFYTFLICTKKSAWLSFLITLGIYFVAKHYFVPIKGTSFDKSNIIYCMPYFLAGGIIFKYRNNIESWATKKVSGFISCHWLLLTTTLIYTVVFFAIRQLRMIPFSDLLLFAFWTIYAVSEAPITGRGERKNSFLNNKIMNFLSTISMEIYLCHMAIFRIVEKFDIGRVIINNDCLYWSTCSIVLASSIIFAVLWKKLEKKVAIIL